MPYVRKRTSSFLATVYTLDTFHDMSINTLSAADLRQEVMLLIEMQLRYGMTLAKYVICVGCPRTRAVWDDLLKIGHTALI